MRLKQETIDYYKKHTKYPNIKVGDCAKGAVPWEVWQLSQPIEDLIDPDKKAIHDMMLRENALKLAMETEKKDLTRKKAAHTRTLNRMKRGQQTDFYGENDGEGDVIKYKDGKPVFGQAAPVKRIRRKKAA